MKVSVPPVPDSAGVAAGSGCPALSVIVPVYRNRDSLVELHRRLTCVLKESHENYELLFVDDSCPEGSLELLRVIAASDPRLGVLALARNCGQQRAVMAGMAFARGEQVVIMDADLQDPPEAIPDLLAKSRQGFDAVFAGRRGNYESTCRLLTSRLFKRLLHHTCGVPADAGIFVVLSRDAARRLVRLREASPGVVAMIGCAGVTMASIPVERSPRENGKSAYSATQRLRAGTGPLLRIPLWKRRLRRLAVEPWREDTMHAAGQQAPLLPADTPIRALMGICSEAPATTASEAGRCGPGRTGEQ